MVWPPLSTGPGFAHQITADRVTELSNPVGPKIDKIDKISAFDSPKVHVQPNFPATYFEDLTMADPIDDLGGLGCRWESGFGLGTLLGATFCNFDAQDALFCPVCCFGPGFWGAQLGRGVQNNPKARCFVFLLRSLHGQNF